MAQAKQHHYPATLVAEFGVARDNKKERAKRDRLVAVARRSRPDIVRERAANVGYHPVQPQPYDVAVPGGLHLSIDDRWSRVERRVTPLVDALRHYDPRRGLRTEEFVRGLVELIGQLMVRHPEFETRYKARTRAAGGRYDRLTDDTSGWAVNLAREKDLLCICGVLLYSQWWLCSSPEPLVGSDLGFCAVEVAVEGGVQHGYVFPLSPNLAVFIGNGPANFDVEEPGIKLRTRQLTNAESWAANEAMAAWAPAAVFGRDERSVRRAVSVWDRRDGDPPLRETVPALLVSEDVPEPPGQVERWLRTLHRAQTLDEPTNANLVDFEECPRCQEHVADMVLWLDNLRRSRA